MQTFKEEITKLGCDRCGNIWQPRVNNPVKCPRCGHRFDSTRVNKTKKAMTPAAKREVIASSPAPNQDTGATVID